MIFIHSRTRNNNDCVFIDFRFHLGFYLNNYFYEDKKKLLKQAEAEVVPNSSLVNVKVRVNLRKI